MEAKILFSRNQFVRFINQGISKSKRRRLNKKAKRKEAEKEGEVKSDQSPSFSKEPPSGVAATITKPADGGRGRNVWEQPSDVPLPSKTGYLLDAQSTVMLAGCLRAMLLDVFEEGETAVRKPVSVDGLSLAIGVSEAVKKRKSEPNQLSDGLPVRLC